MPERTSPGSAVASQGWLHRLAPHAGFEVRRSQIDRLTCWPDTVQVIATRVRVIAIRDPTLRMRALLADLQIVQLHADPSSVNKDLASGGVLGLY